MQEFELREEIEVGGKKYFLQTAYNPDREVVESSFFRSGKLLDNVVKSIGDRPADQARDMAKKIHQENKKNFNFLLNARDLIKDSSDSKPHVKLAEALFRRSLLPEAVEEARLAIEKGNGDSKPYEIIGRAYYRMGDYENAYQSIRNGIEISPDYPDLFNILGLIYLKKSRCGDSIKNFKIAIELNQYYGEAYLNLASAYLLNSVVKEDYELSKDLDNNVLTNLEMVSRLMPAAGNRLLEEIKPLLEERSYQEAYERIQEQKKKERGNDISDVILNVYLMIIHRGEDLDENEIDRYMERVEGLIENNPTFADGYNSLGILYVAKCKILIDKASQAFKEAVEINRNYQEALKNLRLTENDKQGVFILLKALLD